MAKNLSRALRTRRARGPEPGTGRCRITWPVGRSASAAVSPRVCLTSSHPACWIAGA
jgi:hypothetical protein